MSQALKVLFITRAYSAGAGGMERLSYELITSIKELPDIQATVVANETPTNASLLAARLRSILFVLFVAPRAIWAARTADVIHLGDPLLSKIGWLIQKLWRKPVVVTVHGLDVTFSNPIYRLYLKLFFRHFNAYVAISEYAKRMTETWNVTGTIHVIPPGAHDRMYDPNISRNQLDQLLNRLTADTTVLLTTGRLVARKGHAWFVQHVLPSLPANTLYVIAGSGPEQAAIMQTARTANMTDRVQMLGRVSDEALQVLTNTVDVFIQPNISVPGDAEGFGIVLIEAALCNRRVIASNIDGIPAAIHDGKNGHLVEPENTEEWTRAITSASDTTLSPREYTLDHFSWNTIRREYAALFEELK
ncbi:MAG: glycosyltransferase family 4 protein [Candidatus Andersenbacteria bacterium]